jgi:hypothetical protein
MDCCPVLPFAPIRIPPQQHNTYTPSLYWQVQVTADVRNLSFAELIAQNEVSYFQFNFTWSISWRELINRNNLLTLQLVFALVTMMGTKTISTEYFASVDSCIYFSSRLNGQDQKKVPEKKRIYAQCLPKKVDPESVTIYQNWTRLMIIRKTNRIPPPFPLLVYRIRTHTHGPCMG